MKNNCKVDNGVISISPNSGYKSQKFKVKSLAEPDLKIFKIIHITTDQN